MTPSPSNPALQEHVNDPIVFSQTALPSHLLPVAAAHSSTSIIDTEHTLQELKLFNIFFAG